MSKWLNPKIDEMPHCEDILAFIDLKYHSDKEDVEHMIIAENLKKEGFITYGYAGGNEFEDLVQRDQNGETYCYDMEAVVAWMPLPKPPRPTGPYKEINP